MRSMCCLLVMPCGLIVAAPALAFTAREPRVAVVERNALVSFFRATNGETWKRSDGWLGEPGTECEWYGVDCRPTLPAEGPTMSVARIALSNNNVTGRLPTELANLVGLEELLLEGNELDRYVPPGLLQRWDGGRLRIQPPALVHTTTEILVGISNPAVRCAGYEVVMRADGGAIRREKVCKGDHDACRESSGRIYEFDRVARLLEAHQDLWTKGFASKWLDVSELRIRVVRNDGPREVTVRLGADLPMDLWTLVMALEGVVTRTEWAPEGRRAGCDWR